jgi:tRNA acetyltransferase TAN1
MSVVGPDFEKLKRFNLEELRQPLSIDNTNSSSRLKISEDE